MYEVPDRTGRFCTRPFYSQKELDLECEAIITKFLLENRGNVSFPITTDDLETLIENYVADLDSYGDLSSYGENVEGVTLFSKNSKPKVIISSTLHEDSRRENRYRTTLTHEFGHVHFHGYLFAMDLQEPLWASKKKNPNEVICKRDKIIDAPNSQVDWMEWQAGYVCSSLLMPKSYLNRFVSNFRQEQEQLGTIHANSPAATLLIEQVAEKFQVSRDAAQIRLTKLEILSLESTSSLSLF